MLKCNSRKENEGALPGCLSYDGCNAAFKLGVRLVESIAACWHLCQISKLPYGNVLDCLRSCILSPQTESFLIEVGLVIFLY